MFFFLIIKELSTLLYYTNNSLCTYKNVCFQFDKCGIIYALKIFLYTYLQKKGKTFQYRRSVNYKTYTKTIKTMFIYQISRTLTWSIKDISCIFWSLRMSLIYFNPINLKCPKCNLIQIHKMYSSAHIYNLEKNSM